MELYCFVLFLLICTSCVALSPVHKVIVPSVYKDWSKGEWDKGTIPDWVTNRTLQQEYNYSVYLYQKQNASRPDFIEINRGAEAGVYLRYIVDHYHKFPDIAVFVHAYPGEHLPHWLELMNCIHPNASYINFNDGFICRWTSFWFPYLEVWVEQCWRDVLSIIWGLEGKTELLNERVPVNKPIGVCMVPSQQFLISRAQIHRRPLSVWKSLLKIIGEQDVCHVGAPDYKNLYGYYHLLQVGYGLPGNETANIYTEGESAEKPGFGKHTQGGAMEHLAHVVFGFQELDSSEPNNHDYCQNFLADCPYSKCKGGRRNL